MRVLHLGLLLSLVLSNLQAQYTIVPELITGGLSLPVEIANPGDGTNRLFIVELAGRIRILQDGELLEEPFLDLTEIIVINVNFGLSGLAFHPDFPNNGRFFVHYGRSLSETEHESIIAEFQVSPDDPNRANPEGRTILRIPRPTPNHPGGDLSFGNDGYLYISSGDSGIPGDPDDTAQDPASLEGKLLRIDVDGAEPYEVPPDNPFLDQPGFLPEIWALGFRHPYRMSVDGPSGRLFLGDVGASRREEINLIRKGGNYGWNRLEGSLCFPPGRVSCPLEGAVPPIFELDRVDQFAAIIGGVVYRGSQLQEAFGDYVFADFGEPSLWTLREISRGTWEGQKHLVTDFQPSSFGLDEEGEIYTAGFRNGELYRLRFRSSRLLPLYVSGQLPNTVTYRSKLITSNPQPQENRIRIELYDSSGAPLTLDLPGAEENRLEFTLDGFRSRSLSSLREEAPRAGWMKILSDQPIQVFNQLEILAPQGEPIVVSLTASKPAIRHIGTYQIDRNRQRSTALVLVNPWTENATLEIDVLLRDTNGNLAGSRRIELPAGGTEAFFLDEINQSEQASGTLDLRADSAFLAGVLLTQFGLPLAPLPPATP